jgi:hypothetical protein
LSSGEVSRNSMININDSLWWASSDGLSRVSSDSQSSFVDMAWTLSIFNKPARETSDTATSAHRRGSNSISLK